MKLVNPNLNKLKKVKLVRLSQVFICSASLIFVSGCNKVDTSDYYIVSKGGNYTLCNRDFHFANGDDYEYDSIIDQKFVGAICSKGNSFDYESHHISMDFLCELQVVNLKDTIENEKISLKAIEELATSDMLIEIADNYFLNKKYYYDQDFEYSFSGTLKMFTTDDNIIIGYDVSPKRLSNTKKYIYSIIDNDTLIFRSNDIISTVEIENKSNNDYITYNDAIDIINEYNAKSYTLTK